MIALVSSAGCGSRSGIEAPEIDSAVPPRDAGALIMLDAGAPPDAGEDVLPVVRVRVIVTIGGDSLGDTDLFRSAVSEAFVSVRSRDGDVVRVSLNEGATWSARTTQQREIGIGPLAWDDVASLEIEHVAAGEDWNADNWTMDAIAIESISEHGRASERYRESGAPMWLFQKNVNQVWSRAF